MHAPPLLADALGFCSRRGDRQSHRQPRRPKCASPAFTPGHGKRRMIEGSAEVELDDDDELGVSDGDVEAEEAQEPQMMVQHAAMWDNFLAYVEAVER
eukprot:2442703-Pleurochrysis_carterae.AAC.1